MYIRLLCAHTQTKNGNRRGECLLQRVEALAVIASLSGDVAYSYPRAQLDRLWQLLLLNQFHDVLPGSSINAVYVDAKAHYKGAQLLGCLLACEISLLDWLLVGQFVCLFACVFMLFGTLLILAQNVGCQQKRKRCWGWADIQCVIQ